MEPLSVATHALNTLAQLRSGENVVVFGAGPVGLLCMAVARALGAARVVAVDIQKERLDFAKSYAATDIYVPVSANDIGGLLTAACQEGGRGPRGVRGSQRCYSP